MKKNWLLGLTGFAVLLAVAFIPINDGLANDRNYSQNNRHNGDGNYRGNSHQGNHRNYSSGKHHRSERHYDRHVERNYYYGGYGYGYYNPFAFGGWVGCPNYGWGAYTTVPVPGTYEYELYYNRSVYGSG